MLCYWHYGLWVILAYSLRRETKISHPFILQCSLFQVSLSVWMWYPRTNLILCIYLIDIVFMVVSVRWYKWVN